MTTHKHTSETTATQAKATGKHIPEAPPSAAPEVGQVSGEPGSSLNPSDPAAPNYRFQPQGVSGSAEDLAANNAIDQGTGVQPPTPVFAAVPESGAGEGSDGVQWGDENVALGRRLTISTGHDSPDSGVTTYEEILPHGAPEPLVAAARQRLRNKLLAA